MRGKKTKKERLLYTLPATRVTEDVYKRILKRMEDEKRGKITEVVRLTLEDHFAEQTAEAQPA